MSDERLAVLYDVGNPDGPDHTRDESVWNCFEETVVKGLSKV